MHPLVKMVLLSAILIWFLCLAALVTQAYAHDAPSGWSYDASCCNTTDCRPADGPFDKVRHHKVQIEEVTGGYRVSTSKEVVPWNDKRIRESKDGEYHVCTAAGLDNTRVICIYIPLRGV